MVLQLRFQVVLMVMHMHCRGRRIGGDRARLLLDNAGGRPATTTSTFQPAVAADANAEDEREGDEAGDHDDQQHLPGAVVDSRLISHFMQELAGVDGWVLC